LSIESTDDCNDRIAQGAFKSSDVNSRDTTKVRSGTYTWSFTDSVWNIEDNTVEKWVNGLGKKEQQQQRIG